MKFLRHFFRHDYFYMAAYISFCALLSLVPLMLIAVAIVGYTLGSAQDVMNQIIAGIAQILPPAERLLAHNLDRIVVSRHSFGMIGLFLLFFFATLLFGAIEKALDTIFESVRRRNFFHSRLLAIAVMVVISLFFFFPTAADLLTRSLARYGFNFPLGDFLRGPLFFPLFSYAAFLVVVIVIPHKKVSLRWGVIGALIFSAGLILVKQMFRWYILWAFDRYNLIFGSLTAFILLLIWIYYCSTILLVSAEVVALLQKKFGREKSPL